MSSRYSSSNSGSGAGWRKEQPLRRLDALDQGVELLSCIVHVEAGPAGGDHVQAAHQRLRAVMAGADGHAVAVQDGAEVVGVDALQVEGHHTAPPGRALRP